MDLSDTIIPNSDQLNADDLMAGPHTVTIAEVIRGNAEQPVDIHLAEFPGRPWRPSKSMRRVLISAWGKESSVYIGRRVTLYRDPEVMFGRDKVGGIKISHLSDIKGQLKVALTVTRGKRAPHVVDVLTEPVARDWAAEADAITDVDALRALHAAAKHAGAPAATLAHIVARGTALAAPATNKEATA